MQAMEHFKEQRPNLREEADFELENVRECIIWLRFMWRDSRRKAIFLGTMAALLSLFRLHLNNAADLDEIDGWKDVDYNKLADIKPMLMKIRDVPETQIQLKIIEIHSALTWLRTLLGCSGRPGIIIAGVYAILSDSVNHLICFTLMIKTPEGFLTYPQPQIKTLLELD